MELKQVLKLLLLTHCASVYGGRGTVHKNTDQEFQMLLAGGIIPDNGKYVANIVSIRTLNYVEAPGDNHFCMGIIISSRAVLTAAHCVTDAHRAVMNPRSILVVFGLVYRLEYYHPDDTRRVTGIRVHPSYRRYVNYDVSLLRLNQRIPGNVHHVHPIIEASEDVIPDGTKCITLGWGQVYPHGPYANELLVMDVTIRPHKHCANLHKYTSECNICVEPHAGGQVCPGDLGGPLMCHDHVFGIIGGTLGCEGVTSMKFVNYNHISHWIDVTTAEMSASKPAWLSAYILFLYLLQFYLFSN